jgi:hypothetical protein
MWLLAEGMQLLRRGPEDGTKEEREAVACGAVRHEGEGLSGGTTLGKDKGFIAGGTKRNGPNATDEALDNSNHHLRDSSVCLVS